MKRASPLRCPAGLALLAWCGFAPSCRAATKPARPRRTTNIPIDPAIAKASAEADADAGNAAPDTNARRADNPQTPYEKALLNYKAGKYDAAKILIDEADQESPGNVADRDAEGAHP